MHVNCGARALVDMRFDDVGRSTLTPRRRGMSRSKEECNQEYENTYLCPRRLTQEVVRKNSEKEKAMWDSRGVIAYGQKSPSVGGQK